MTSIFGFCAIISLLAIVVALGGYAKVIENESFVRRQFGHSQLHATTQTTSTLPTLTTTASSTNITTILRPLTSTASPSVASASTTHANLLAPMLQMQRKFDLRRRDHETTLVDAKYYNKFARRNHRPRDPLAKRSSPDSYDPTSRHTIDYRKVYGLRYVPNKIRRSYVFSAEQTSAEPTESVAIVPPTIEVSSETSPTLSPSSVSSAEPDDDNVIVDNNQSSDATDAYGSNSVAVDGDGDDDESENDITTETATESIDPIETTTNIVPVAATQSVVNSIDDNSSSSSSLPASDEYVADLTHVAYAPAMRPPTNAATSSSSPLVINAPLSNIVLAAAPSRVHSTLQFIRNRVASLLTHGLYGNPLSNGQRFLSLFSVIKFANEPCASNKAPLQSLNGTCYNQQECDELGGVAVDQCANGYGVCCVFQYGCGGVTSQNISYFKSPGFPAAHQARLVCTLTLELWPNVKQVLVEFLFFELKPPTDGTCSDDQFVITGQNVNSQVPIVCGVNSGQHMYVNVESSLEHKLFLSVLTSSATSRAFNIRVSQLQDVVAPAGCLQYFTDITGFVQTFNYDDYSEIVDSRRPSYFNNLNYAICVRRAANFCTIAYANQYVNGIGSVEYPFQLVNVDEDGFSVIPAGQAGAEIYNCADDFIAVNGIRLCGEKLNDASLTEDFEMNAPVQDFSGGPIVLPVRTNAETVGRGFKLYYEQQPCLTI